MAKTSLKTIAKYMKGLDLCMLTTTDQRGSTTARPMSNNGDVSYDGTSYFFTYADSAKVRAIKKNPKVSLQFVNMSMLKRNTFISVEGHAKLTTDRAMLEEHWVPSLNVWFPDGLETKGIMLIAVKATRIRYWSGMDSGEFKPTTRN